MNALLAQLGWEVLAQGDLGVESPPETGLTFVENALIKARNAAEVTGLPAIADDSGIEVDVLDGQPGIYSARYAGEGASDEANLRKLVEALRDIPAERRTARYQCVVTMMRHPRDPTPLIASAAWEGVVIDTPRGQNGFGYDPIFFLPNEGLTAAELAPDVKNRVSHRGRALEALKGAIARLV